MYVGTIRNGADLSQTSLCKKILSTPKIFKFKDRFTSTYNYCTSLHFGDRIDTWGSQGQGPQSLGQNSLPEHPDKTRNYLCLGHLQFLKNLWANFGFNDF